jgi:hypothetical protein
LSIIKKGKDGDRVVQERFIIEKNRLKMPKYDESWLIKQDNKVEFVWPSKEFVPAVSAVNLAVKHKEGHKAYYFVNGKAVDSVHFNKRLVDKKGKALTLYKGVHLKDGTNLVVCEIRDESDRVIKKLEKKVHFSTMPVRAEVIESYSKLVADGKQIPVIAVKFTN